MSHLDPVLHAARHFNRLGARAEARDAIYGALRAELLLALQQGDPQRACSTPAWPSTTHTAAEIALDLMSGAGADEQRLDELLRIVGMCARGKCGHECHLRASAWLARLVHAHADAHADDAVDDLWDDPDETTCP